MQPFLKDAISNVAKAYSTGVDHLALVFPNRRSALVSKKYAQQALPKGLYAKTTFYTIEDFIQELSGLNKADTLTLCTVLYRVVSNTDYYHNTFEHFYHWGLNLINDFDQVDKHLVDAKLLFTNVGNYKSILNDLKYLDDDQVRAIKSFWSTFTGTTSKNQNDFVKLWSIFYDIYVEYRTSLLKNMTAYTGLQYRHICQQIDENKLSIKQDSIAFLGFGSLCPAEEFILKWLKRNSNTNIWWDVDSYYINDTNQEAGLHLRRYYHDNIFKETFPRSIESHIENNLKNVTIVECNTDSSQIDTIIENLILTKNKGPVTDSNVIVVLDDDLLLPLLDRLPPEYSYNITMGYPISATLLYELVMHVLELLLQLQDSDLADLDNAMFAGILEHRYIELILQDDCKTVRHCEECNDEAIQVKAEYTYTTPFIKKFSDTIANGASITSFLADYIASIQQDLEVRGYQFTPHESKSFSALKELCNSLSANVYLARVINVTPSFINIWKSLASNIRIPFELNDDPNAIQIMGMLETRNLDFDNIFIMSMNEGIYPSSHNDGSFIPYSLRFGYNLPRFDVDSKSTYAYHFYRLLHRAQHLFISYNSSQSEKCTGEMSSYLLQLIYESKLTINLVNASHSINLPIILPININKDKHVKSKIDEFITSSPITPSIINTYLSCSLRFYFQYIAAIEFDRNVSSNALLGIMFHKCMHQLYSNYFDTIITHDLIAKLQASVDHTVNELFVVINKENHTPLSIPDASLIADIVKNMVKHTLMHDHEYAPFTLLQTETKQECSITLNDGSTVMLSGIIDRIDQKDYVVRVIDYKTGRIETKIHSIETLFNRETTNNAALQVLFYSYLTNQGKLSHHPGIIESSNIQPTVFDVSRILNEAPNNIKLFLRDSQQYIDSIKAYSLAIELGIKNVLEEIKDIHTPFQQTNDLQKCTHCPYIKICQRH
jgi:CRISPR/Cas system-associated exonuclease Cas4 (RecB family)